METRIFVSGKIKSAYKKLQLNPLPEDGSGHLNSWNAHYKTFQGKKCWFVTHAMSRYTVFVPDVKVSMLKDFQHIFLDCLVNQLLKTKYQEDLQITDPNKISQFIGEISFFPTNNDKGCLGTLNQRAQEFELYKEGYSFDEFSFQNFGAISNWYATKKVDGKSITTNPVTELTSIIKKHFGGIE